MYRSKDHLIIFDADGKAIDAFSAIDTAFARYGMNIGDLERFQKCRNLFKYLGGIKEFPRNLAKHLGKYGRSDILATLTEVYREEAMLYPGVAELLGELLFHSGGSHLLYAPGSQRPGAAFPGSGRAGQCQRRLPLRRRLGVPGMRESPCAVAGRGSGAPARAGHGAAVTDRAA